MQEYEGGEQIAIERRASQDFSARLDDLKQVYTRAIFLSYLVQRIPITLKECWKWWGKPFG
ncbi:hypothetical protein ACL6C3_14450 [Capilliphycus salinus ALCB114379]|uniref:hypothetical protein n=1 Tax=Capilliphycus salinus TaxID=2768948 RepID=UPI0039A5863B